MTSISELIDLTHVDIRDNLRKKDIPTINTNERSNTECATTI